MDKQLLKAYIRTVVEDEVKRVLPEVLSEAIGEIKKLQENTVVKPTTNLPQRPKLDRSRLAEMMGLSYDGQTLSATTNNLPIPENVPPDVDPDVMKAVTKDYSAMMKKMGLT
jgi:hypothetical protein